MIGFFRNSLPLLKIRGIPVEINYSWLLIFLLVSINLATGWLPSTAPGAAPWLYYVLGCAGSLAMFFCVLIHELSHSLVAQRLGLEVRSIVLHIFGGVSLIHEEKYTPQREFLVTVAGPIASLLLSAVFLGVRAFFSRGLVYSALSFLFFVNLLLAVFNLLPGFPLDGGRLVRSLIAWRKKDFVAATRISARIGVAFAVLLIAYGAIEMIRGDLGGLWVVLIGIFLKEAAEASSRRVMMQEVFSNRTIAEIMQHNPVTVPPEMTVQEAVDHYFWRYHYGSFPVGNGTRPLGIIAFNDVKRIDAQHRAVKTVAEVMHPVSESLQARPDETILSALEKVTQNGVARLIVVDDRGEIIGYLSLRDIARSFEYRNLLLGR